LLPTTADDISRWNGAYYKIITPAYVLQLEAPDGTVTPSITATGGFGSADTVDFQSLKGNSVTADIRTGFASLLNGLTPHSQSLSMVSATVADSPSGIPVDITGMENIIGSDGNDSLTGDDVANALGGGDGLDTLNGGLGNDYLDGGPGADLLDGGDGQDLLDGGLGADVLKGGNDSDAYFVDDTNDIVVEGATEGSSDRVYASVNYSLATGVYVEILSTSDDQGTEPLTLAGNEFDNHLIGNAGVNVLYGMGGSDVLEGLGGDDSYVVDTQLDQVIELAGGGYDTIFSPVSYVLAAGTEVEALSTLDRNGTQAIDFTGNEFGNALYGNAAADKLTGGGGNDVLDGGAGADTMIGGIGDDTYIVDSAGDVVTENAGEGTDEIRTSITGYVLTAPNVENLTFIGTGPGDIRGNASNNVLSGGTGNDFLRMQDGGNDTAYGGDGNDAFYFGAAYTTADSVDGGAGSDQLALQGNYSGGVTMGIMTGVETLVAMTHSDARFGGGSANPYSYLIVAPDAAVAAGTQLKVNASTLEAGENLTFNGSAETDGTFFIYGGKGVDTLTGGAGADVFFFAEDGRFAATDHVDGGGGSDQMVLRGNYSLTLSGSSLVNVETVVLMSGSDARFYSAGTPFSYDITTADDTVAAGETMTFNGGQLSASEMLHFDGSLETNGSFRLFGGSAADVIKGGAGNDLIYGGLGADQLTGGGGADTFRYQGAAESTAMALDVIQDFVSGSDKLDLGRVDANSLVAGDQAFSFIGAAAFSAHGAASAGELRVFQSQGTWFVAGDTDGDGTADLLISLHLGNGSAAPVVSDIFL
jgi:Ca2+-binding RTX toxin-like protein